MRALIVVESMFGNTEHVARAIAAGLSGRVDVDVVPVSDAPGTIAPDIDLLVVGGPTHVFGMTRERTREDAVRKGGHPEGGPGTGVREWVETVNAPGRRVAFAAFDTRVGTHGIPGSAARGIDKRLTRLGFRELIGPISFIVEGTEGPLHEGEAERAQTWGADLATRLAGRSVPG